MNIRAPLLIASGVILGAATIGAVSVSAHERGELKAERKGHVLHEKGHEVKHPIKHIHRFSEELLGMTPSEVKDEIESGKSLEEIVSAQGYDSIESFRDEVEILVREELAERGFSNEEIDEKIERHQARVEHKIEHLSENFDEAELRERLESRGLSEEEVNKKIDRLMERIDSFLEQ